MLEAWSVPGEEEETDEYFKFDDNHYCLICRSNGSGLRFDKKMETKGRKLVAFEIG